MTLQNKLNQVEGPIRPINKLHAIIIGTVHVTARTPVNDGLASLNSMMWFNNGIHSALYFVAQDYARHNFERRVVMKCYRTG